MKITIEVNDEKATIEGNAINVEESVDLCSKALSAIFGYGVKLDYETYFLEKEDISNET